MKRILCLIFCLLVLFSFVGCNPNNTPLSGYYITDGGGASPYLHLNSDTNNFRAGQGMIYSFAIIGTYKIKDGMVIASSEYTTVKFEILDKETLVLIDKGDPDYFDVPVNTIFSYNEKL